MRAIGIKQQTVYVTQVQPHALDASGMIWLQVKGEFDPSFSGGLLMHHALHST